MQPTTKPASSRQWEANLLLASAPPRPVFRLATGLNKLAEGPGNPTLPVTPAEAKQIENPAAKTNQEALAQLLQLGLTGVGIGAGTRGLLGLRDLVSRPAYAPANIGPKPAVVEVNVPSPEEDERKRKKLAEVRPFEGDLSSVPKIDVNSVRGSGLWNWLKGLTHTDITSKPFYYPAAIGTGIGSLYAGYKGVDTILNARHKADREKELEDAKREFQNALVEQYKADGAKSASPNLEREWDILVKQATPEPGTWAETLNNAAGKVTGGYLALAALLAAGSGIGAYQYTKSQAPENRIAKAIKQRERLRWASKPPEIYAVSKPTSVVRPPSSAVDEDQDEASRDTVKSLAPRLAGPKLASVKKPTAYTSLYR